MQTAQDFRLKHGMKMMTLRSKSRFPIAIVGLPTVHDALCLECWYCGTDNLMQKHLNKHQDGIGSTSAIQALVQQLPYLFLSATLSPQTEGSLKSHFNCIHESHPVSFTWYLFKPNQDFAKSASLSKWRNKSGDCARKLVFKRQRLMLYGIELLKVLKSIKINSRRSRQTHQGPTQGSSCHIQVCHCYSICIGRQSQSVQTILLQRSQLKSL